MNTNLIFEYAIQNQKGEFYNGNCYGDQRDWTKVPMHIFTYTEQGAYKKLDLFPAMFNNCKVVHI